MPRTRDKDQVYFLLYHTSWLKQAPNQATYMKQQSSRHWISGGEKKDGDSWGMKWILWWFRYCLERISGPQGREEELKWSPTISMLRRQSKAFRESKAAKFSSRLTERGKMQKETLEIRGTPWVFSWVLICPCMEGTTEGHGKNTQKYYRENSLKSNRTSYSSSSHNPEWKTSWFMDIV